MVTLNMSNEAGFVSITDLVPLSSWGSTASEEQVLEILTKFGSQFLEISYDDTIVIKDKAHDSVPSVAEFKNSPVPPPLAALSQATVVAIPRSRSSTILHALRWLTSSGSLVTSPSGAVVFIQFINALSALEEQPPDPWRDLVIANADPSLTTETIGGTMWLSHIDISRIQLVKEEWFKVPHESKTGNIPPAITTPLAKTPQESGSTISPSPTKDYATSDKSSGRSEEIPFTLSSAIAAQALT